MKNSASAHEILDIMPYSDRYDLAAHIVGRFQGRQDAPVLSAVMAQQFYAEDLKTQEHGIATRLEAPDHSYSVWLFQSLANAVPGLVPNARLELYGHCQTHQDAVDHANAEAWTMILATADHDLFD